MSTNDSNERTLQRRTVLGGIAGLGMLSLPASYGALEGRTASVPDGYEPHVERSRHPGHPRFVEVGERLTNPVFVGDVNGADGPGVYGSRDNLAPGASPNPNSTNYDAADFEWSIADRPTGSEAQLTFASPSEEYGEPRYDEGRNTVAEFEADVPGRYRLTLAADDGRTHELTIHAFPAGDGPRPRIELEGRFQRAAETDGVAEDRFVVESNPALAPDSQQTADDLEVVFLADDRDPLSTADITVEDGTAVIPKAALGGETARVHAAAHDGQARSMMDTIELDPTAESVSLPNRPPEWVKESVIYQIFTRSWAGERFETDFGVMIDGDEGLGAQGLDYLADLGIDAVWLTPIVPAVSSFMHRTEKADATGRERGHYVGGGPHGYDATDYFDVAPDLAFGDYSPLEAYRRFVEECHKRDIKVIFDTVINHAGRFHDYFQDTIGGKKGNIHDLWWYFPQVTEWNRASRYFDWFDRVENPRTASGHPKFADGTVLEPSPRATGFFGLPVMPNWNYDNLALREHILACIDFWTGEIGVDGLRCDIAWGVPHSFWKEAREVARANNGDVLLFDESIPNEPTFAENEFDMHYDKVSFTDTAVHIAEGQGDATGFLDAMKSRKNDGFPDHTLFYNAIENHDEKRILDAALENYDDPAYASKLQRACWAAGVTLPGVPAIYYGQEREISKYGGDRHMGAHDPRDGDISPGDMRRAFMNWGDEFDGRHLEFYRTLIDVYHRYDVLQTDADVAKDRYDAGNNHVLVFGRDASDLEGVTGPERVLVAINYEPEPVRIDLRDAVDNVDLVSGNAIDVASGDGTMTVEVDTVAVLETPDFKPPTDAELLALWPDEPGDDAGPGWYEYPTASDFSDGAFDLEKFEIRDAGNTYQFVLEVENLENVWDGPNGFSQQFPQIYVHDPASDVTGSSETIRDGVNLTFEKPYHHQIMGTGDWGGWIDPADGSSGESLTVYGDETTDEIVFEVPRRAFDSSFENLEFAPVLLGFDGNGPGGARPVTANGGEWKFEDTKYGTAADGTRHNVVDIVTPAGIDNSGALAYDDTQRATVPFVDVQEGKRNAVFRGDRVAHYQVGSGTDVGPGTYTYPTTSEIPDGALDVGSVSIYESEDVYTFAFRFVNPLDNPWGGENGFSHPHVQLYLHDLDGENGKTEARPGVNATFEHEYHYWIAATMEWTAFQDAHGSTLGDLELETYDPENAIVIRVARDAIDGDLTEMGVAPLVFGYDGYGEGGIRSVTEGDPTQWNFGGAENANAPTVIDMVTPSGVSRADALAYDETSRAEVPFTWLRTYDTVRQAIVGDGPLEKNHVRSARDYWANGDPVPQTDRETIDYETVRKWARELGE